MELVVRSNALDSIPVIVELEYSEPRPKVKYGPLILPYEASVKLI